jgi:hypothetical protein
VVVKVEAANRHLYQMPSAWYGSCRRQTSIGGLMFAMDVQWLAISLGSVALGFIAILMFACARAAGLADRSLEELFGHSKERHKHRAA